ncbi:MAG: S8 family serine peptidase [Halanaerobacter sp.]
MANKKVYAVLLMLLLSLTVWSSIAEAESNLTVFIVDSKVDFDFIKNLSMVSEINHGSVVGRIIYQEAPEVNLSAYEVEEEGRIKKELYYAALRKIIHYQRENPGQRIIVNISLSFSRAEDKHKRLIDSLAEEGVMIITAGGNQSSQQAIYPAGFESTIAVANATKDGKAASSNYGSFVDISAPGSVQYISRLYLPQGTTVKNYQAVGTSFSAPRVAALLAKLLILEPNLSLERGMDLILNNADAIDDLKYEKGLLGTGVINIDQTLAKIDSFYYFKTYSPILLGVIIFLSLFFYYWQKYQLGGLFLGVLLILVVLPLGALVQEILWGNITELGDKYQQLKIIDYILIVLVPLVIIKLSNWQRKFVLSSYLLGLVILFLSFNIAYHFSITTNLYLRSALVIIIISLIISERIRIYQAHNKSSLYKLVPLLISQSEKTVKIAKQRLKSAHYSLASLLRRMKEEEIPYALIEEVVRAKDKEINLVEELLTILKREDTELDEIVISLLSDLESEQLLDSIKAELRVAIPAVQYSLLRLIAELESQDDEIVELVLKILFLQNDMWLRYQALLTLTALSSSLEEIKIIIEELRYDSQEIVRLEAQNLWAQLED